LTTAPRARRHDPHDSYHKKTERHSAFWPVQFTQPKENAMQSLSRRSLVATAAVLPALGVPAAAFATTDTDSRLLVLGEKLKPLWAKREALRQEVASTREICEAAAKAIHGDEPGWGLNKAAWREYERMSQETGHDQLSDAFENVCNDVQKVAEAILEIPSHDPIGDGIHAAAALAIDDDVENGFALVAVLEQMAHRAGFTLPAMGPIAAANEPTPAAPDPVFAAIAAHRQAYLEMMRAGANCDSWNASADLEEAADAAREIESETERELAAVVPTTMAGVIALLRYCEEHEEQRVVLPEDPKNWHSGDPDCASLLRATFEHETLLDKGNGEPLAPPMAYWIMQNVREALQSLAAVQS
jgi:hypothetical protein